MVVWFKHSLFISKLRWSMTFHLKSTSRFISNVWWFQTIHFIPKVLLNLRHVVSPQDVLRQFVSSQEYDGFRQFVSSQSIVVYDISFHLKVWWFMTVRFISFPTHVTSVYALWATRAAIAHSHGLAVKDPNVHVSAVVTLKGLAMYAIIIGRFWILRKSLPLMQTRYRPPPADALPHRSHLYSLEEVANKDPACSKCIWQCMLVRHYHQNLGTFCDQCIPMGSNEAWQPPATAKSQRLRMRHHCIGNRNWKSSMWAIKVSNPSSCVLLGRWERPTKSVQPSRDAARENSPLAAHYT